MGLAFLGLAFRRSLTGCEFVAIPAIASHLIRAGQQPARVKARRTTVKARANADFGGSVTSHYESGAENYITV
jgi:hypothetical protein